MKKLDKPSFADPFTIHNIPPQPPHTLHTMNSNHIKINDTLHIQESDSYSLGHVWKLVASNYGTTLFWARTKTEVEEYVKRWHS